MVEKTPKIKWDNLDMNITHQGKRITLPGDPGKMPIAEAIKTLQRKMQEEETLVKVFEIIDAYPLDAAVAFVKAMRNTYGWASPVATPGFFGDTPPIFIPVKTGKCDEDVVQCPLGSFMLPNVENRIETVITRKGQQDPKQYFIIHGIVKQKDKAIVIALATECRRIVREESIYRGKALRVAITDSGTLDMNNPPDFIDTSGVDESCLIFNEDTRQQIETNILVPIKH